MKTKPTAIKYRDTYVYIDVSNIRWACVKTLDFQIDFVKLLDYFRAKYPNLKEVRYYEGIAKGDQKKRKSFRFLKNQGYTICALQRKSYQSLITEEWEACCPKCQHQWTAEFSREKKVMKSNVDVYLASDMMVRGILADHPIRIILVSCDGDYAEAIKNILRRNRRVAISVLATPHVTKRNKNTLSVRLRELLGSPRYSLHNIDAIRKRIENSDFCAEMKNKAK